MRNVMHCMRSIIWFPMDSYVVPYKRAKVLDQYYYSVLGAEGIYWIIIYLLILEIRKRFFTKRVVRHWNRLLRAVVMVSSLTEAQQHLDNSLRHRTPQNPILPTQKIL